MKVFSYMYIACFRLDRHDYDTSLHDTNVPPKFTLPLIDQVKKVRETVELTVTGKYWMLICMYIL